MERCKLVTKGLTIHPNLYLLLRWRLVICDRRKNSCKSSWSSFQYCMMQQRKVLLISNLRQFVPLQRKHFKMVNKFVASAWLQLCTNDSPIERVVDQWAAKINQLGLTCWIQSLTEQPRHWLQFLPMKHHSCWYECSFDRSVCQCLTHHSLRHV